MSDSIDLALDHGEAVTLAVVQVNHSLSNNSWDALRVLAKEVENIAALYILCASAPTGERLAMAMARAEEVGARLLVPDRPLSIGLVRSFAIARLTAEWITFVDEDCYPKESWASALYNAVLEADSRVALFFGPRDPDGGSGLGSTIRRLEGNQSRKHRGLPCAIVAGGNMVVQRDTVVAVGMTSPAFENVPWEDYDLQLRLYAAGHMVKLVEGMRVAHVHDMGFLYLLVRSARSGMGLARLAELHGRAAVRRTRWRPIWLLPQTLAPVVALGFLIASCSFSSWTPTVAAVAIVAIYSLPAFPRTPVELAGWLFLKPVRNVVLLASYCIERFRTYRKRVL